jgi:lactoylglutathione lyase
MTVRWVHAGIAVSDLEASVRFYTEGLGFERDAVFPTGDETAPATEVPPPIKMTLQYLTKDGFRLGLMGWELPTPVGSPSRTRNQLGLTHLTFEVDDLDATVARLVELGGSPVEGTRVDLGGDPPVVSVVIVTDPDGVRLELIHRRGS